MKRKSIILTLAAILVGAPLFAVFNEKDLSRTLSVLRFELQKENQKRDNFRGNIKRSNTTRHTGMVEMMKRCNELSLVLYSQNQDYTFDVTYALKEVTRQYEEFNANKMPFDEIVGRLDTDIDRYSRLLESLRRLPPELEDLEEVPDSLKYHNDSLSVIDFSRRAFRGMRPVGAQASTNAYELDEKGQQDRDSCIYYASALLKLYAATKESVVRDSLHYQEVGKHLKEAYSYAQENYENLQTRIFTKGQDSYFTILKSFGFYVQRAVQDATRKYGRVFDTYGAVEHSEWRGPVVISFMGLVLLCIIISTILGFFLAKLLKKRIQPCMTLFVGVVIFAVIVSVTHIFLDNNFFVESSGFLLVFAWIIAAILISLCIRLDKESQIPALKTYLPLMVMGFLVVGIRIVFMPNRMINLLFPPIILAFSIWQLVICRKGRTRLGAGDLMFARITLFIFGAATVITLMGYIFLGLQLLLWWLFQITAIETIVALKELLRVYERKVVLKRLAGYRLSHSAYGTSTKNGEYIGVTWLYDFLRMTLIPVVAVISVPLCLFCALNVFDMAEVFKNLYHQPIVSLSNVEGNIILHLSFSKIVTCFTLYFVFRYLNYLTKAIYRKLKYQAVSKSNGSGMVIDNQVNLTLANNLIGIALWGIYIAITVIMLKIPMGAISIIAAGLATGIGLAMKDILNNFIYGIQLMSGRLRVGDWVDCDGVRGKVTAISYQSTQIETTDGAVMSFLNTTLFNKNFKNLTRNNSYEFVKIVVGVAYGTDVNRIRAILLDVINGLQSKDKYGRDLIDFNKGVSVAFDEFSESSIDIAVKQYVLVSERAGFIAKAKEGIYNALNDNGIEIPFPQRDIHVIQ